MSLHVDILFLGKAEQLLTCVYFTAVYRSAQSTKDVISLADTVLNKFKQDKPNLCTLYINQIMQVVIKEICRQKLCLRCVRKKAYHCCGMITMNLAVGRITVIGKVRQQKQPEVMSTLVKIFSQLRICISLCIADMKCKMECNFIWGPKIHFISCFL